MLIMLLYILLRGLSEFKPLKNITELFIFIFPEFFNLKINHSSRIICIGQ